MTFAKIELQNNRFSVSEILGVFVNTLTADDKYSLCNRKNLPDSIELQLSKKEFFSLFFAAYWTFTSNFEHLEKNMALTGSVFSKFETTTDLVN